MDLKDLGVTIRELLRYGYAGGLALFLLWWLAPQDSRLRFGSAIGLTIGALLLGVFIYSVCKVIGCDILLTLFVEAVHRRVRTRRCIHALLADNYNVDKGDRTDAFRVIRDRLFSNVMRERFHVQNTEIHTIYVTGVELLIASPLFFFFSGVGGKPSVWVALALLVAACMVLIIGAIGQMSVCRQQCAYFLSLGREETEVRRMLDDCRLTQRICIPRTNAALSQARWARWQRCSRRRCCR
jgi:hypothetical protein